ncbi:MAG: hypothetical protein K8R35_01165 [Bacteroidales bacterium]|nr:hypothetical protein [Bacteroidales bacterium]
MKNILSIKNNKKVEILYAGILILLYLFRTTIPFFKYPFLILLIAFLSYIVIIYRKVIIQRIREFIKNYYLIICLGLILSVSFLLTYKLYLVVFKDVLNFIIIIILFFILSVIIRSRKDFTQFIKIFLDLLVIFAILISLSSFMDFIEVMNQPMDNTLSVDKNFALLPLFYGLFRLFHILVTSKLRTIQIFFVDLLFIVFSFQIYFSGSRRGIFFLVIIVLLLIILQVVHCFKVRPIWKIVASKSVFFIIANTVIVILLYLFIFNTSYKFKSKTLHLIGIYDVHIVKAKFAEKAMGFVSLIQRNTTYSSLYKQIWTFEMNPNDPESGWGSEINRSVFPLSGVNVEIVPAKAIGYMMDSTCQVEHVPSRNKCETYSLITKLNSEIYDRYYLSVYCYVSEEFNGTSVSLGIPRRYLTNGTITGEYSDHYNLKEKGIWKKLEFRFEQVNENVDYIPLYIIFSKVGVSDYSNLNGYIIFAYPEFHEIGDTLSEIAQNSKFEYLSIKKYYLSQQSIVATKNEAAKNNKLVEDNINISKSAYNNNYLASIYSSIIAIMQQINEIDEDPFRNWVKNIISEDSVYRHYTAEITIDSTTNNFILERTKRWNFAIQIYAKEFNWAQKIFGGGFAFLNWYGTYFYKDKTKSDWPHNPILFILLYSGIIGMTLYLIIMYKSLLLYLRYLKEYYLFFIFFLITYFFTFFSGGSPFDPPVMGFFMIFPFFINTILKDTNDNTTIEK